MQEITIPFNRPYMVGSELGYIAKAVQSGKISGDGMFSKKCHEFFQQHLGFRKALLTTSCTDALEMAALLLNIKPGDEVIAPSYTFVSTVNAFILRGATIRFADSTSLNPNIDPVQIAQLITDKTKVILPVHYAGIACDMNAIMPLAKTGNIHVVEDAAQCIAADFIHDNGTAQTLGSFGTFSAFSFHETKNVIAGEGGMLVINNPEFEKRAEIIREKGTNRSAFFRGEVDKYGWVDVGSSFLPSDLIAAFLYAQLEALELIQQRRMEIWNRYWNGLKSLADGGRLALPVVPSYAKHNAHMFYILLADAEDRDGLIKYLRENGVYAVFHYLSLHDSTYFKPFHDGRKLPWSDYYSECLLRLPFYNELTDGQIDKVVDLIATYCKR